MDHDWNTDDIIAHFTQLPPEIRFWGHGRPIRKTADILSAVQGRFFASWLVTVSE